MIAALAVAMMALPLDEEAAPFDWVRPAKGGKTIFVMLRHPKFRKYAYDYRVYANSVSNESKQRDGKLFLKYPSSGLYPNDGSTKPIWKVDWYAFEAWPLSDGKSLVRWGGWPRSKEGGAAMALTFYRAGKELQRYVVSDLVKDVDQLPFSVSHYQWLKAKSMDDATGTVKVVPLAGGDYTTAGAPLWFDARTGKLR